MPERRWAIRAILAANRLFCRTYQRVDALGPCYIPSRGPAILVCNHVSGLDPLLIQSTSKRLITWMMAREYYEMKSLRWLYELIEAIPVERSGRDMAATRAALRALDAGRILGVFPEGKFETTRDLLPFQTGVAMMAIKTRVPVLPAYLEGTQRGKEMVEAFAFPNQAAIDFGPPVEFNRTNTSKDVLEAATERIQQAVATLKQSVHAKRPLRAARND